MSRAPTSSLDGLGLAIDILDLLDRDAVDGRKDHARLGWIVVRIFDGVGVWSLSPHMSVGVNLGTNRSVNMNMSVCAYVCACVIMCTRSCIRVACSLVLLSPPNTGCHLDPCV